MRTHKTLWLENAGMPADACPSKVDLAAYALGKLSDPRSEEIDIHLDQCTTCQAELETCGNADDTFFSHLRETASAEPFTEESDCIDMVARVAAIGKEASFATQRELQGDDSLTSGLGDIGPYRLLAKLGQGGMGAVYKAFHTKLKRIVALKLLPSERTLDTQSVARFEREMEAVGKLDHPNIVRATDAGEHDGKHFLVMEYVEGIDLADLVRQHGPLPVPAASEIIRQAAIGLQHAYEHGLVHRDVKPSNLMLTKNGTVKLLDLGLALLPDSDADSRDLTSTNQAMGTLDYMAPEQGDDSHDVDIRADIYALGATFYKLLCGEAVFSGPQYQTPIQKWKALALAEAPSIQSRGIEVPDELAAVVHRMIARDRDDRFTTPSEVIAAVARFCPGADLPDLVSGRSTARDSSPTNSTTSFAKEAVVLDTWSRPGAPNVDGTTATLITPRTASRRKLPRRSLVTMALLGPAILAAAVFFMRTPHGTLRVEINDPEIEVRLKGEDIVLTGADKKPITLKAGEHALIVSRGDDFTFETKQLILNKGEAKTVHIELLPGKVQVVSAGKVLGTQAIVPRRQSPDSTPNFALRFDENSHIRLPEIQCEPDRPFTVEARVVLDKPNSGRFSRVIGIFQPEVTFALFAEPLADHWRFSSGRSSHSHNVRGGPLALKRAVHLAGVWDGQKIALFVDGRRQTNVQQNEDFEISGAAVDSIGARIGTDGLVNEHLIGTIDEVRLSKSARYTSDFTPPTALDRFQPDGQTIALYHCDEGAGDVLRDSSGNKLHGKIVGATWVRLDKPPNQAIDLLAGVNLSSASHGKTNWKLERNVLTGTGSASEGKLGWSVLVFPSPIKGDYDLTLDLNPNQFQLVQIDLPLGDDHAIRVHIGGLRSALIMIDGKTEQEAAPPYRSELVKLHQDSWQHLTAQVRHQGDNVRVDVALDGERIGLYSGARSRISLPSFVKTYPTQVKVAAYSNREEATLAIRRALVLPVTAE